MKLISTPDLATELGAGRAAVGNALNRLDVQPVYQIPQGAGFIDIWDRDAVFDLVKEHLAPKKPVAPPAQAPLPWPQPDVNQVVKEAIERHMKVIAEAITERMQEDEATAAALKRIGDQNVLLLRMLEDIRANAYAKIDALQATVDDMHGVILGMQPKPSEAPPADAPPPPPIHVIRNPAPLKRVAILSLLPDQKAMIEREFGKAMDLRIFSGQECRDGKIQDRIANCDVVLVMNNFIDGTINDHIKKSKVKAIKVTGGLTKLRDELTNLFLAA